MLYSPPQDNLEESRYLQSTQGDNTTDNQRQHGTYSNCHLLGIPSETLTGITSYLDPLSLYSLARVNTILYHHVEEDNTWRRAFASRYLGIGPENDLYDNVKSILLRRSERTWKNEFITRFRLERKWETSRSTSISHVPVPSAISHIHLMSCQVVLSSCLKYGIVARSLPLNGKVYGGYLSAAANGIGIGGIGNPNMEFVPNASTCAVTSRGSSASLLWGFLDGSVAVVLAEKVMNPRRITAEFRRCNLHEEHQGIVSDSAWDDEALIAVTCGTDGQVKLWNADPLACVWASEKQVRDLVADPCVKVAISMNQPKGSIVAAFHSGKVCLWTGFQITQDDDIAAQVREFHIPCPLRELDQEGGSAVLPAITSLHIDSSHDAIALLIAYKDHPYFYRVELGGADNSIETTAFGDPSFGPITIVSPFFASQSDLGSFMITGDSLGCISVYDWRAVQSSQVPVKPVRKFEAHEDGAAVTAIGWNGVILMTGSSRAAIHVWDGLSFAHLRSFVLHPRRHRHDDDSNDEAIKQIIIDTSREMFVASAGDRVLAWRADPLAPAPYSKRRAPSGARHVARRGRSGYAKYLEQADIKETIKETRHVMEQEHKAFKRAINKEKEHRAQLDKLGLTEAEAVEYAMMLSLEDAADGAAQDVLQATDSIASNSSMTTEDVFDIDEAPDEGTPSSSSYRSLSPASISTAYDHTWNSSGLSHLGSPASHCEASHCREVMPQNVSGPELQASSSTSFVASISSLSSASSLASGSPSPTSQLNPTIIEAHFPPITTGASAGGSANSSAASSSSAHSKAHGMFSSTSSSERGSTIHDGIIATRSVDASISEAAPKSGSSIPKATKSWSSVAGSCLAPGRSATRGFRPVGAAVARYTSSAFHATNDADLDEDLRYALELSLAEAKSRGEAPPA